MLELCLGGVKDGAEGSSHGSCGLGHFQAGSVRRKHGLSKAWPGFLCTNLNLIWGWQQCPSRRVSLGINRKGSDCFGGISLQRKLKAVSVNKVA